MSFTEVRYGMVVGPHPATAEAGLEMLRAGGNVIDAIVAAAFAEAVAQPAHNGVAGYGGCLVAYLADRGKVVALDYNTTAPQAAHESMYPVEIQEDGLRYRIPGRVHLHGPQSVGVPGIVGGLCRALEEWGTRPRTQVLAPAIRAATEGVLLNKATADSIRANAEVWLRDYPDTAALFLPGWVVSRESDVGENGTNVPDYKRNGTNVPDYKPPEADQTLAWPELAETLQAVAEEGPEVFYAGRIGQRIGEHVHAYGGTLTPEDLAAYEPRLVAPLHIRYRGCDVFTPPLAAGGLTTLQLLRLLEIYDVVGLEPDGAEFFHLFLEAMKVAWQERLRRFGDPRFVAIDEAEELSEERISEMRARVERGLRDVQPGELIAPDPLNCTSHISAADARGNLASLTQTHGGGFGSWFAVPGPGLVLGHGMSRFDPRPGRANSIAPGKQPLHNMAPLILLREGQPYAAVGAPGGRTIPNNMALFVVSLLDHRRSITDALAAPRLHCESSEPANLEKRADESILAALRERGHQINPVEKSGGPAHGIVVGETLNCLDGATDPRGEGKVVWA